MGSASLLSLCINILTAPLSKLCSEKELRTHTQDVICSCQVAVLIQASWCGYDTTMKHFSVSQFPLLHANPYCSNTDCILSKEAAVSNYALSVP